MDYLKISDVSALGAAYLSGLTSGIFRDLEHLESLQKKQVIQPKGGSTMQTNYKGWLKAVKGE